MIIHILFSIVIMIFNTITSWLPSVTVLPFGIDDFLITATSIFKGAFLTLPYLTVVWNCFLYILGFEGFMLLLKVFLGSRVPSHNAN